MPQDINTIRAEVDQLCCRIVEVAPGTDLDAEHNIGPMIAAATNGKAMAKVRTALKRLLAEKKAEREAHLAEMAEDAKARIAAAIEGITKLDPAVAAQMQTQIAVTPHDLDYRVGLANALETRLHELRAKPLIERVQSAMQALSDLEPGTEKAAFYLFEASYKKPIDALETLANAAESTLAEAAAEAKQRADAEAESALLDDIAEAVAEAEAALPVDETKTPVGIDKAPHIQKTSNGFKTDFKGLMDLAKGSVLLAKPAPAKPKPMSARAAIRAEIEAKISQGFLPMAPEASPANASYVKRYADAKALVEARNRQAVADLLAKTNGQNTYAKRLRTYLQDALVAIDAGAEKAA